MVLYVVVCSTYGGVYFSKTGKCYKHYHEKFSWVEARAECKIRHENGDLAVISNQDILDFVKINFNFFDSPWIGVVETRTGEWTWADGTPWTDFGQIIYKDEDPSSNIQYMLFNYNYWNGYGGNSRYGFFCQF